MRTFKIPNKFSLYGKTYTVEYNPNLCEEQDILGAAYYKQHRVVLQTPDGKNSQAEIEQTFLHELMHLILTGAEDTENKGIGSNEGFVDRSSNLLHQFFVTQEFDEEADG